MLSRPIQCSLNDQCICHVYKLSCFPNCAIVGHLVMRLCTAVSLSQFICLFNSLNSVLLSFLQVENLLCLNLKREESPSFGVAERSREELLFSSSALKRYWLDVFWILSALSASRVRCQIEGSS